MEDAQGCRSDDPRITARRRSEPSLQAEEPTDVFLSRT